MGYRGLIRTAALVALVASLALMGCGNGDANTLELPDAADVERVQATADGKPGSSFTNREGVGLVLEVLASLGDGWEPTDQPLPPMRYSASLSAPDNTILLVIWIGDDWLAANDMQGRLNARRAFVDPDRERLLRSLGVGPYFDAVDP